MTESAPKSPFDRALRLVAPGAAASFVVALFATIDSGPGALTLGVACGALAGAAVRSLFSGVEEPATSVDREPAQSSVVGAGGEPAVAPLSVEAALGSGVEVLRRLPQALVLLDDAGVVAFANDAADAEVGVSLLGRHYAGVLRAPGVVEAVKRAYDNEKTSEFSFSMHRAHERHMTAFVGPLPVETPGLRVMILIEDDTKIRRAEQLHRDFVANASHELKTPLASIAGFIETLQVSARDDPAAQERFLRIMAQQAERMRRLVDDLLSLNRIELNEHVPPRETVDLDAVIDDAVALTTPPDGEGAPVDRDALPVQDQMAFAEKAEVEIMRQLNVQLVRGDRRELTQLFVNLLTNAHKYGGAKKPVRVSVLHEPGRVGRVGVCVEDFGPGIAKEHLPRLTERFYRVDVPASRNLGGTGLGLAIVKHIIARHRGEMTIDSALGRGSRFTIWLPIDASGGDAQST